CRGPPRPRAAPVRLGRQVPQRASRRPQQPPGRTAGAHPDAAAAPPRRLERAPARDRRALRRGHPPPGHPGAGARWRGRRGPPLRGPLRPPRGPARAPRRGRHRLRRALPGARPPPAGAGGGPCRHPPAGDRGGRGDGAVAALLPRTRRCRGLGRGGRMQPVLRPALSVVVPVYGNAGSIQPRGEALRGIARQVEGGFEAVFVVDGSPDESHALLAQALPAAGFPARLVELTRNFGAFPAIRVGLERARGAVIAVMAADLQEPPGLALGFLEALRDGRADVAFGVRDGRQDPPVGKLLSSVFWALYRGLVMPDIPRGGVDVFAI